jgi:hypothetical protein
VWGNLFTAGENIKWWKMIMENQLAVPQRDKYIEFLYDTEIPFLGYTQEK